MIIKYEKIEGIPVTKRLQPTECTSCRELKTLKENGRGVEYYSGERGSSRRRDCVAFLDFFAKTQEARELIKNRELNLYVSRDRLSHRTKIIISINYHIFLQDYDVKMPNSRFMDDVNKQRRNFISLSELGFGPLKFRFRRVRLQLTK